MADHSEQKKNCAEIDDAFREIIAKLALKPVISSGSLVAGSGHGAASTKAPKGTWDPYKGHYEAEILIGEYERAISDEGRKIVLEKAEAELKSWKRKKDAPKGEELSFEQRVVKEGKDHSPEEVGQHFKIDPHLVRRIRKRFECGTEDGRPINPKDEKSSEPIEARRLRVQELKRRNFPNRRIADILGVPETTVRRDLQALKFKRA